MEKKLNILLVNDDGIWAEGMAHLAKMAVRLGDVWIAAPKCQCSGMSQKLTIFEPIAADRENYPQAVREAWSIGGTPADCVKLALRRLLPVRPDIVFSGINDGANTGFDIAYSGTMGAAMEALMCGVPAIAFSKHTGGSFEISDRYIYGIAKELTETSPGRGKLWNVNIPSCPEADFKGILRDRSIAPMQMYIDGYTVEEDSGNGMVFRQAAQIIKAHEAPEGSDIHALLNGHISIGRVSCAVL